MTIRNWHAVVLAMAVVALLLYISADDFKAQQQETARYCLNVKKGVWPDYQESYERDCGEKLPKSLKRRKKPVDIQT